MPVISAEKLIEIYIGKENHNATEIDFMKALELVRFTDQEDDGQQLKVEIWCECLSRDTWNEPINDDNNQDYFTLYEHTLFFKLLKIISVSFSEYEHLLPNIDEMLLRDEMIKLKDNNRSFEHTVRWSIEQVMQSKSIDSDTRVTLNS